MCAHAQFQIKSISDSCDVNIAVTTQTLYILFYSCSTCWWPFRL